MTRRRILEIVVAAGVFLLLLTVFLVRPTSKRTAPPAAVAIPLFERVTGTPPDFASGSYSARIAGSPDSALAAVLYPDEFEERADVYLVHPDGSGHRLVLADPEFAESTPKNLGWLDKETLWVTIGYQWGTVSPGGELFLVDPQTGRGVTLWASPDSGRTQATGLRGTAARPEVELAVFDANLDNRRDSTAVLAPQTVAQGKKLLKAAREGARGGPG